MTGNNNISIRSRDFWFKVVQMGQQNWALVDTFSKGQATIYFLSDLGEVFDKLSSASLELAHQELLANGFARYANDERVKELLLPPGEPFAEGSHPNGPIYSSGRFWQKNRQ